MPSLSPGSHTVGIKFGGDSRDAQRAAEAIIRDLEKLSRQAISTAALMNAALGSTRKELGDVASVTKIVGHEHDVSAGHVDRHAASWHNLRQKVSDTNRAFQFFRNTISVLKWPAIATAIGYAAQAINALVAGATALIAVLGTLGGLLAAAPGLFLTMAGAIGTVVLAFGGLKEALGGNKEAFEKLTPEAQKFVKELTGLKSVIKDLRQSAQQGLFPGLTTGLRNIFSQRNVNIFKANLKLFGQALGDTFAELGKTMNESGFAADMNFLMKAAAGNFRILGHAGIQLVKGFQNLAVAAQPLVDWLTKLIGKFGEWVSSSTEAGRASGGMARFFAETKQTMQELGKLFGEFGHGLINIFRTAAPLGHALLQALGGSAEHMRKWTETTKGENALAKFFKDAQEPLMAMGRLVRDVVGAILSIGTTPELTALIEQLRTKLVPTLELVLRSLITGGFGKALVDLAVGLGRIIALVAGANGPLVTFTRALAWMADKIADLIEKFPPLRSALFGFLGILAVNKLMPFNVGITNIVGGLMTWAKTMPWVAASTSTAMRTIKAAFVSTGIGVLLVGIGLIAEQIIFHWDKVAPFLRGVFNIIKGAAKILAGELLMYFGLVPKMIGEIAGVAAKAFGWIPGIGGKLKEGANKVKDAMSWMFDTGKRLADEGGQDIYNAFKTGWDTGQRQDPLTATITTVGGGTVERGQAGAADQPLSKRQGKLLVAAVNLGPVSGRTYKFGTATDCSGYVVDVYAAAGIKLPHNAAAMWARNSSSTKGVVEAYNEPLEVGDAVFFLGKGGTRAKPGHVGLYVGRSGSRGDFIEYYASGKKARYNWVSARKDFVGSKRWMFVEETGGAYTGEDLGGDTTPAYDPEVPSLKGGTTKTKPLTASAPEVKVLTRRVEYIQKHLGQIISPQLRAKVKRDIDAFNKLFDELKKGGFTEAEIKRLTNRAAKIQEGFRKALETTAIQRQIAKFRSGFQNIYRDVLDSLKPETAQEIAKRMQNAVKLAADLAAKGLNNAAKNALAQARDFRQRLVETLAENISSAKDRVSNAFSSLFDQAMSQLEKKWANWLRSTQENIAKMYGVIRGQTAASRRLQEFREARDLAAFQKSVLAAQKELQEAEAELARLRVAGAAPEDIKQAEERVLSAKEAVYQLELDAQERQLQKQADAEEQAYQDALDAAQKYHDERLAAEQEMFKKRYDMIVKAYNDEKITAQEAQMQILGLLGEYGIDPSTMTATAAFSSALQELGDAIINLAKALREAATIASGGGGVGGGVGGGGGRGASAFEHGRGRGGRGGAGGGGNWASILFPDGAPGNLGQSILDDLKQATQQIGQYGKTLVAGAEAAFTQVAESKEALGENYEEFTLLTGEWTQSTLSQIESIGKTFRSSSWESVGALRYLTGGITETIKLQDAPLTYLRTIWDLTSNSIRGIGGAAKYTRNMLRDTVGEIRDLLAQLAAVGGGPPNLGMTLPPGFDLSGSLPYQHGGIVPGHRVGRDSVLIRATPGEVILNAAQQENLARQLSSPRSPIVVQINRPVLLGRSLAVADEIASSVGPALNRRIGYSYRSQ